jgi:hypothetical protein
MVGYEQLVRVRFLYCLFSAVAAELHKAREMTVPGAPTSISCVFLTFAALGTAPGPLCEICHNGQVSIRL